jgi:hypothetical protein
LPCITTQVRKHLVEEMNSADAKLADKKLMKKSSTKLTADVKDGKDKKEKRDKKERKEKKEGDRGALDADTMREDEAFRKLEIFKSRMKKRLVTLHRALKQHGGDDAQLRQVEKVLFEINDAINNWTVADQQALDALNLTDEQIDQNPYILCSEASSDLGKSVLCEKLRKLYLTLKSLSDKETAHGILTPFIQLLADHKHKIGGVAASVAAGTALATLIAFNGGKVPTAKEVKGIMSGKIDKRSKDTIFGTKPLSMVEKGLRIKRKSYGDRLKDHAASLVPDAMKSKKEGPMKRFAKKFSWRKPDTTYQKLKKKITG